MSDTQTLTAVPTRFVDILPDKHVIAESATSERAPIPPEPEVRDDAKVEAKEEPKTDEPKPEAKDEAKPDETPPWQKAFVTKEKNRRKALEDEVKALREQNAQIMALVEKLAPPVPPSAPKKEMFASEEEYIDALSDWKAQRLVGERDRKTHETHEMAEARKRLEGHEQRLKEAADRYPDIEDVARDPTLPVSQAMGLVIMESEAGPDLLHWIDEHREEAAKIAALSPAKAAAELGKIELKLATKPAVTVSKAPKPIVPVGSNNNVQRNKDDPELSDAEWAAQLDAERAAKVASLRR